MTEPAGHGRKRRIFPDPGFTGAGIDRADLLRIDEPELARLAQLPDARLLRLDGLDPLLGPDGRLDWTHPSASGGERIFLGMDQGRPLFAPLVGSGNPGARAWSVFGTLSRMHGPDAALWGAVRSLNLWHSRHLHCGICGSRTVYSRAGWGRRCSGCEAEHFPRVDPVVIMLAEHRERVLVARQPLYPAGRYSALAGFVEPGESIEEAVQRELMEEAGLPAYDVRYVGSQPWPFPGSLMIACIAKAPTDALRIDHTELEDAMWVDRNQVEAALEGREDAPFQAPPPFAIAHSLFRSWLEEEAG